MPRAIPLGANVSIEDGGECYDGAVSEEWMQLALGVADPVFVGLLEAVEDNPGERWILELETATWSARVAVPGPETLRTLAAFFTDARGGDALVVGRLHGEPVSIVRCDHSEQFFLRTGRAGTGIRITLEGDEVRKVTAATADTVTELDESMAARHDV